MVAQHGVYRFATRRHGQKLFERLGPGLQESERLLPILVLHRVYTSHDTLVSGGAASKRTACTSRVPAGC